MADCFVATLLAMTVDKIGFVLGWQIASSQAPRNDLNIISILHGLN